jgi:hypothetical protein
VRRMVVAMLPWLTGPWVIDSIAGGAAAGRRSSGFRVAGSEFWPVACSL